MTSTLLCVLPLSLPVAFSLFTSGQPVRSLFVSLAQVVGTNFGLATHPLPVVTVGTGPCASVNRINATHLQCRISSSSVGRRVVNVSLGGLFSAEGVFIDAMCGEGYTGLPGNPCKVCPTVRALPRGFTPAWTLRLYK